MARSKHSAPVVAGAIVATGVLVAPVVASAAPSGPLPSASTAQAAGIRLAGSTARAARRPFRIRLGKVYIVHDTTYGIRSGDRAGLRVRYATDKDRDRDTRHTWHRVGSYRLHEGQRYFRGRARASTAGLFNLQLFLIRHHHVVRHSFSNVFSVRVLHRKLAHKRRPKADLSNVKSVPADHNLPGWTNVGCGGEGYDGSRDGQYSHVLMNPPFDRWTGDPALIEEVTWSRDAVPGGSWGPWYPLGWWQFDVYPNPTNTLSIDPNGPGSSETIQNYPMEYGSAQTEVHQLAWDMAYNFGNGWTWYSNEWYTPGGYTQVPNPATGQGGGIQPYCWSWLSYG